MDFKILFFICIVLVLINSACEDRHCSIEYNPLLEVRASPAKDTFNVGDTIFFEIKSSIVLEDMINHSRTNFHNARFNLSLIMGRWSDTATSINSVDEKKGLDYFKYECLIGEWYRTSLRSFNTLPIITKDSFLLKWYVIPLEKGLYNLSLNHRPLKNNKGQKLEKITSTKCKEYVLVIPRFNNGNINQHLVSHLDTIVPFTKKSKIHYFYEQNAGFIIYVK